MTPDQMPQTGGYMAAAYIAAAVLLVAYTIILWRRGAAKAKR
ncbi:MAG TPA: hypothetical protein VLB49_10525 [Gemmatimonadales bacterium]|nr:hypothetical protein [Gemmatimonadales bacterium]